MTYSTASAYLSAGAPAPKNDQERYDQDVTSVPAGATAVLGKEPTLLSDATDVRGRVRSVTTDILDASEQRGRQEALGVNPREYSRGVRQPGPPTKKQDAWDRYVRSVRGGVEAEIKQQGDRYDRVMQNKE